MPVKELLPNRANTISEWKDREREEKKQIVLETILLPQFPGLILELQELAKERERESCRFFVASHCICYCLINQGCCKLPLWLWSKSCILFYVRVFVEMENQGILDVFQCSRKERERQNKLPRGMKLMKKKRFSMNSQGFRGELNKKSHLLVELPFALLFCAKWHNRGECQCSKKRCNSVWQSEADEFRRLIHWGREGYKCNSNCWSNRY